MCGPLEFSCMSSSLGVGSDFFDILIHTSKGGGTGSNSQNFRGFQRLQSLIFAAVPCQRSYLYSKLPIKSATRDLILTTEISLRWDAVSRNRPLTSQRQTC